MVKDPTSTLNIMAEATNRCTMVRRMWTMTILILTLVGMATIMMLQLPMNPMDLVSKRMGKLENIFFIIIVHIFLQSSRYSRDLFSHVTFNQIISDATTGVSPMLR